MSAITTGGMGEQGGLITTAGWGGQPEGEPALPSIYKPRILDSLELRPTVEESVAILPQVVDADLKLEVPQPAAKELRPVVTSQSDEHPPTLTGKELKPKLG